jgi:hypothetical protein
MCPILDEVASARSECSGHATWKESERLRRHYDRRRATIIPVRPKQCQARDRRMRTPCGANAVAGRPERTPDRPHLSTRANQTRDCHETS